jgi:hypothetical protein
MGTRCVLQNCDISFCGTTLSPTTSLLLLPAPLPAFATAVDFTVPFSCRGIPAVWIPGLVLFFFFRVLQKNWQGASIPEPVSGWGPVTFANWTMCYMCGHFSFTFFFFQKWTSCFLSAFSLCWLWLRRSKHSGDTSNIFATSQVLWNLGEPTT